MPMHDWTRVDAGIYHMFHGAWLVTIARALNNGVLPPGYYAMSEQVTATISPDIVTLRLPGPRTPPPAGNGAHAAAANPPVVGLLERAARAVRTRSRRRLAIRHTSNHEVVAAIEVVSPGNKSSNRDFRLFVEKGVAVLTVGVHLVVVDPFPPTARDPNGMHGAIWRRVAAADKKRRPFVLPADRPLTAVSYAAGSEMVAAVQSFAVGQAVPDVPLFLTPEQEYVTLPLEPTYAAAFPDVPRLWRDVLEA